MKLKRSQGSDARDNPYDIYGSAPKCLKNKIQQWWNYCDSTFPPDYWWQTASGAATNCMMFMLMDIPCTKRDCDNFQTTASTLAFFFSPDCSTKRQGDLSELNPKCSAAVIMAYSPVSLLIGADSENDGQLVISEFPLNPNRPRGAVIWKASAQAPLLVYDPEHTGRITSAHQLFGEWSFGGKKLACLNGAGAPAGAAPWRDGFKAMASLDADSDGMLSAGELEPLGLWFDANRDGVSQPGEVKPIGDAGIVRLYYKPDRVDGASGSIYVSHGYDRVENGRLTSGRAVDWYGKAADSRYELMLRRGIMEQALAHASGVNAREQAVLAPAAANLDGAGPFSGVWLWKEKAQDSAAAEGVLVLTEKPGDSKLIGAAALEVEFNAAFGARQQAGSVMLVTPLKGTRGASSAGEQYVEFSLTDNTGATTSSRAVLTANGKRLDGKSTISVSGGDGTGVHSYEWSATKLQ